MAYHHHCIVKRVTSIGTQHFTIVAKNIKSSSLDRLDLLDGLDLLDLLDLLDRLDLLDHLDLLDLGINIPLRLGVASTSSGSSPPLSSKILPSTLERVKSNSSTF